MKHQKLPQQMIGLTLIALLLAACSASSNVMGTLTDQTGRPLSGARVVLCRATNEKTCVIDVNLTSLANDSGNFQITDVKRGNYIVLYNISGKSLPEWETLEIDFTPTQTEGSNLSPVGQGFMDSTGVASLSVCAWGGQLEFDSSGKAQVANEHGYLYSPDLYLAFILVDGKPISIDIREDNSINISVWDPQGECDSENFAPLGQS